MPPVPPARRPSSPVAAATRPLSAKHRRFLHLLCANPGRPSAALGQQRFDALPQSCRDALVAVTTSMPFLDQHSTATLEAYYASGYRPNSVRGNPRWFHWEEDLKHATALMEVPEGGLTALMASIPGLSDHNVIARLLILLDKPELKPGERIRLEAVRLIAELKGWRTGDQAAAVQATQIVIHTSQEPAVKPQNEPKVIEIEL